jgi:cytoskeleton protein RodZ
VVSFGQSLRQAREARNITLQEIAATTKIGTRALQALEGDRFDQLPGGIFNKGFVRSYARCVGLDEEKTLAAYLAAAKVAPPETDMQALASPVSAARMPAGEPWPWWALNAATFVGLLAVIVALGLGALWLKEHRRETRELAAPSRTESSSVGASAPASIPPQPAVVASDPNAAVGGVGNPAVTGATNATPDAARASNSNQNPPQSANQGANQAAVPASPVEISVSATARAWISVSSDGKKVEQLVLDPDKPEMRSRTYKGQEKVLLIVGNPSGVTVTYNGKPAGALGIEGRRAMVTFTPQGIEKH